MKEKNCIGKTYVMEKEWDNLIILDACRYDYFKKVYSEYLEGKLKKALSPSFHTEKWRKEVFTDSYEDIVYISANPYINSKAEIKGFDSPEHFYDIIDVWAWGWNKELGTVHPCKVNEAVEKALEDYPTKGLIIHYLQPHAPYLSLGKLPGGNSFREVERELDRKKSPDDLLKKVRDSLGKKFVEHISWEAGWKINQFLGQPPAIPEEAAYREVGREGMMKAYKKIWK